MGSKMAACTVDVAPRGTGGIRGRRLHHSQQDAAGRPSALLSSALLSPIAVFQLCPVGHFIFRDKERLSGIKIGFGRCWLCDFG